MSNTRSRLVIENDLNHPALNEESLTEILKTQDVRFVFSREGEELANALDLSADHGTYYIGSTFPMHVSESKLVTIEYFSLTFLSPALEEGCYYTNNTQYTLRDDYVGAASLFLARLKSHECGFTYAPHPSSHSIETINIISNKDLIFDSCNRYIEHVFFPFINAFTGVPDDTEWEEVGVRVPKSSEREEALACVLLECDAEGFYNFMRGSLQEKAQDLIKHDTSSRPSIHNLHKAVKPDWSISQMYFLYRVFGIRFIMNVYGSADKAWEHLKPFIIQAENSVLLKKFKVAR